MTEALRRIWAKDLGAQTLYELLKLRVEVFVVEQAIPYPELDGRDLLAETRHFWLETPGGEVTCTLRLMEEHAGGEKVFRIGRLCTKRNARGQGHTTRLLRARTDYGFSPRMFASGLLQYSSAGNLFSSNLRFRWEYRPGSELFVVYTDERDTTRPGYPDLKNRAFVVKVNRLLRF